MQFGKYSINSRPPKWRVDHLAYKIIFSYNYAYKNLLWLLPVCQMQQHSKFNVRALKCDNIEIYSHDGDHVEWITQYVFEGLSCIGVKIGHISTVPTSFRP